MSDVIRIRCKKHDVDLQVNEAIGPLVEFTGGDGHTYWDIDLSGFMCPEYDPDQDTSGEPCDNYWEMELGYIGFVRRKAIGG